jgi:hypothetical protein
VFFCAGRRTKAASYIELEWHIEPPAERYLVRPEAVIGMHPEMYLVMLEAVSRPISDESPSTGGSEAQGVNLKAGAAIGMISD